MINRIKNLFDRMDKGSEYAAPAQTLAAAVLLVEAARLDGEFGVEEKETICSLIKQHFALEQEEVDSLVDEAKDVQEKSNHLVRFTRTIKETYSTEERVAIIEMLWEVVYADGVLHDFEANLLRRVGGLIYVSDRDRGAARKRVTTRLGINEAGAPK